MMTQETQHLEFLISQYVDNVLDAPNRKFVEQQLAADPDARELLKQHREAQELLDDYGSRLPLINWNEFDAELAAKLDAETAMPRRLAAWRRWARPVAAAAALALAASLGYGWHAYTRPVQEVVVINASPVVITPETKVTVNDRPRPMASAGQVSIPEFPAQHEALQVVTVDPGTGAPSSAVAVPGGVQATPTQSNTAQAPDFRASPFDLH